MRHRIYTGATQTMQRTSKPLIQGPRLIGAYLTYPAGVVSSLAMVANRRCRADTNLSMIFTFFCTLPCYGPMTLRRKIAPEISLRQ